MAWDTTLPADNEAASQGASRIRDFKSDIQTALRYEGNFAVDAANPKFIVKILKGTTGARPAASTDYPGRLYMNTTTGSLQRVKDDGSAWEDVMISPSSAAQHQAGETTLASLLGVVTLDETSNLFKVTGTEAVTSLTGWTSGVAVIRWNSARTLTHGSSFALRGSISRTVAAGDVSVFEFFGSAQCREIGFMGGAAQSSRTVLSTAGAGTYTTPTGIRQLRARMVGAGGGGGGCGSVGGSPGVVGGDTIFGSVTAKGGPGGAAGSSGVVAGGAGGTGGGGSADFRIHGGAGDDGVNSGAAIPSSRGGGTFFGPGAAGTGGGNNAGKNADCPGGGGGGGISSNSGGAGGSGGEYAEITINDPAATYSYTVGAKGAGGAGISLAGGNGADGIIIIDEIF